MLTLTKLMCFSRVLLSYNRVRKFKLDLMKRLIQFRSIPLPLLNQYKRLFKLIQQQIVLLQAIKLMLKLSFRRHSSLINYKHCVNSYHFRWTRRVRNQRTGKLVINLDKSQFSLHPTSKEYHYQQITLLKLIGHDINSSALHNIPKTQTISLSSLILSHKRRSFRNCSFK